MTHRSRRVELAKGASTSNLQPFTRYSTSTFLFWWVFSPQSARQMFFKIVLEVEMVFPQDVRKFERNSMWDFGENSTQSFGQWSKIAKTEKTETESIRVSRELLHTLRDRSRGEGMVWGRGDDRGGMIVTVTLVACERYQGAVVWH